MNTRAAWGILAVLLLTFGGCATEKKPLRAPSQLDIRGIQSREYDTHDVALVMKAVLNVLQDMGYIVSTADEKLGLLTASKWTDIEHSKQTIKEAKKQMTPLSKSLVMECTANISALGKQCRVRVNFQQRTLDATGATLSASPIVDARFYQTFFSQVDKGIYLQREGI
ncbi:MAG TPA: hypothetical protein PLO62_02130 [Candidatus Hydrogenedentes bacterium]|nr:hypothetical protein [Candidatus Hydrogenedentota bacterium]HOS01754.1 hypothetical protein [Candidatus Hydrogenedentota bacterium]